MFDNSYVNSRLEAWAAWRAKREDSGLGYPKQSAFMRLLPSGGSFWTPEMTSAAEEIDKCVVALIPERRLVIMLAYTRNATIQQKAKLCGCCEKTYYNRLAQAQRDILGYLNDLAAGVPLPMQTFNTENEEKKFYLYA